MIQINESAHKAVFDLEDIENCNIQILNSLGAQIESFQINAQQMTLDLSKFPKGNYAIKLETSKQTFLKTIEII